MLQVTGLHWLDLGASLPLRTLVRTRLLVLHHGSEKWRWKESLGSRSLENLLIGRMATNERKGKIIRSWLWSGFYLEGAPQVPGLACWGLAPGMSILCVKLDKLFSCREVGAATA